MTAFWIVAALLLAGALLFILPPLLRRGKAGVTERTVTLSVYRDQMKELEADVLAGTISKDQFEKGKDELERRLLDEVTLAGDSSPASRPESKSKPALAAAIALAVPVCAILIYLGLGHPEAIAPGKEGAHAVTAEQIAVMVERLAARLKENPNDAEGWHLLARSYTALGRFPEAADAYAKASALTPSDPQLLADYADTLALANGRNLAGKPLELVQAALKLDPNNQKSLALAGTAAFDNRDYPTAIEYWQRLRKTLPPDSDDARTVDANIAEARAAAGGQGMAATQSATANDASAAAAPSAAIAGTVSLSPSLEAKAAPTDTVFIFARAASGPKMPLAIVRVQAKDLPKAFTLDDSMAMGPAMKLSNFQEVVVGARVSKSGNAAPQSGDLSGSIGPVKVGSRELKVVIDGVVP